MATTPRTAVRSKQRVALFHSTPYPNISNLSLRNLSVRADELSPISSDKSNGKDEKRDSPHLKRKIEHLSKKLINPGKSETVSKVLSELEPSIEDLDIASSDEESDNNRPVKKMKKNVDNVRKNNRMKKDVDAQKGKSQPSAKDVNINGIEPLGCDDFPTKPTRIPTLDKKKKNDVKSFDPKKNVLNGIDEEIETKKSLDKKKPSVELKTDTKNTSLREKEKSLESVKGTVENSEMNVSKHRKKDTNTNKINTTIVLRNKDSNTFVTEVANEDDNLRKDLTVVLHTSFEKETIVTLPNDKIQNGCVKKKQKINDKSNSSFEINGVDNCKDVQNVEMNTDGKENNKDKTDIGKQKSTKRCKTGVIKQRDADNDNPVVINMNTSTEEAVKDEVHSNSLKENDEPTVLNKSMNSVTRCKRTVVNSSKNTTVCHEGDITKNKDRSLTVQEVLNSSKNQLPSKKKQENLDNGDINLINSDENNTSIRKPRTLRNKAPRNYDERDDKKVDVLNVSNEICKPPSRRNKNQKVTSTRNRKGKVIEDKVMNNEDNPPEFEQNAQENVKLNSSVIEPTATINDDKKDFPPIQDDVNDEDKKKTSEAESHVSIITEIQVQNEFTEINMPRARKATKTTRSKVKSASDIRSVSGDSKDTVSEKSGGDSKDTVSEKSEFYSEFKSVENGEGSSNKNGEIQISNGTGDFKPPQRSTRSKLSRRATVKSKVDNIEVNIPDTNVGEPETVKRCTRTKTTIKSNAVDCVVEDVQGDELVKSDDIPISELLQGSTTTKSSKNRKHTINNVGKNENSENDNESNSKRIKTYNMSEINQEVMTKCFVLSKKVDEVFVQQLCSEYPGSSAGQQEKNEIDKLFIPEETSGNRDKNCENEAITLKNSVVSSTLSDISKQALKSSVPQSSVPSASNCTNSTQNTESNAISRKTTRTKKKESNDNVVNLPCDCNTKIQCFGPYSDTEYASQKISGKGVEILKCLKHEKNLMAGFVKMQGQSCMTGKATNNTVYFVVEGKVRVNISGNIKNLNVNDCFMVVQDTSYEIINLYNEPVRLSFVKTSRGIFHK